MPSFIIVGYVWQMLGTGPFCHRPHLWAAPKKLILNRVKDIVCCENVNFLLNFELTSSLPLVIDTISCKGHKRYCFCLYLFSPSNFLIYMWFLRPGFVLEMSDLSLHHSVPCEVLIFCELILSLYLVANLWII